MLPMFDLTVEYIAQRWETFPAKLHSTQNAIIINREFFVHWIDDILNQDVRLTDPAGNVHTLRVRMHERIGLFREGVREMIQFYGLEGRHTIHFRYNGNRRFDIQIMDSASVEIQYAVVPPPDAVVPPANVAANEQPVQNENMQHDVVGWDVIATAAFVSGRQTLHIPAHVVQVMFEPGQRWLDLISDAGLRVHASILKKNKRTRNERSLGGEWYPFCRELDIHVGDVVQFRFFGNPYELRVSVV